MTLGNLVGGFVFTGLALYATYKPAKPTADVAQVAVQAAKSRSIQPMKLDTAPTADFSDEQKRYLEGFMSGMQVGRVGAQPLQPAARLRPALPAEPIGPGRRSDQGAGQAHGGGQEARRPGEVQARAASVRCL